MEITAERIAQHLKGEIIGDPNVKVRMVAKIEHGKPNEVCILHNDKYQKYLLTSNAGIVIVSRHLVPQQPVNVFRTQLGKQVAFLEGFDAAIGMVFDDLFISHENNLVGINVLPYGEAGHEEEALRAALWDYYNSSCKALDLDTDRFGIRPEDFVIETAHIHGAYNNAVEEVRDVMYYLARKEAIIIDPCYTGKTFEAIYDGAKDGTIPKGSDVIFMHTGGLPGIYTKHHRIELERELMPYMHIGEF